jgi:uncharacterized protein
MNPIYRTLLALCFFISANAALAQYTVETVPNTKLVTGSYVSNPDNILGEDAVAEIDLILKELEDSATAQVAVVVLNSIGDEDETDFSTRLFEKWGIGSSKNDNGLLILFVGDKKRIRFETGDGIEGLLPDAVCKSIQVQQMVPFFKEGNYDAGMIAGVREVARILNDPEANASGLASTPDDDDVPFIGLAFWIIAGWLLVSVIVFIVKIVKKKFSANPSTTPTTRMSAGVWFLWYLLLPVVGLSVLASLDNAGIFFGGLYTYLTGSLLLRRGSIDSEASRWAAKGDYQAVYSFYQANQTLFNVMRFFFPLPFAFMYAGFKNKMQFYRDHPRNCKQCGKSLTKLDENSDDTFLTKSQLLEETLKSVDYDIWKCSSCNAAEKLSYINASSQYSECPSCKARAYHSVSNRTISSATTSSSGTGEEVHACKACNTRNVRRYTIPKLSSSSSSSSGGSSSGGSWGGGRSSGGGASSGW